MTKRGLAIGLLLPLLVVGIAGASWKLSPTLRERVLQLGLVSGIPAVQAGAASALGDYPTRATALALVTFVNWAHQAPVDLRRASNTLARPDQASEQDHLFTRALLSKADCMPRDAGAPLARLPEAERRQLHGCLEEALDAWEPARQARLDLAGSGFRSLCTLTGETFETRCRHHGGSASWGTLSDREWRRSLGALNGWALETFGGELLAAASRESET